MLKKCFSKFVGKLLDYNNSKDFTRYGMKQVCTPRDFFCNFGKGP